MRLLVLAVAFHLIGVTGLYAQSSGGNMDVEAQGVAYHRFARSGEVTIQILVVGEVRAPGIYEVGERTDLGQLLALAGGTSAAPSQPGSRQEVTVRLFHNQGSTRQLVYEEHLENLFSRPDQYPRLADGDVLSVEVVVKQSRWDAQAILRTISSIAAVTYVAVRIIDSLRRR